MIKLLITGANGLVGQKLCELALENPEIELLATSYSPCKLPCIEHCFEQLDISMQAAVANTVERFKPNVIINSAGITQVDDCENDKNQCWQINVNAVQNIISAAKKQDAKLIQLSTDFVFDGNTGLYRETDEPNPVSVYGESKLEAERIIQNQLTNYNIVRTVLVYGVTKLMTRSNLILWVKGSLEKKQAINVVNDQYRTPTLAEDLAGATLDLALSNHKGIYHISGNEYLSIFEIAEKTAGFFDLDNSLMSKISSASLNQVGKRPPKTGFNISKAQQDINYSPSSLTEGLAFVQKQLNDIQQS